MRYDRTQKDAPLTRTDDKHGYWTMMDEATGCGKKVWAAIGYNADTEYHFGEIHDDLEVFLVLEGSGWATVGDQEFPIQQGTCYAAPAGMRHGTRSDRGDRPLRLYWFHAPQTD